MLYTNEQLKKFGHITRQEMDTLDVGHGLGFRSFNPDGENSIYALVDPR